MSDRPFDDHYALACSFDAEPQRGGDFMHLALEPAPAPIVTTIPHHELARLLAMEEEHKLLLQEISVLRLRDEIRSQRDFLQRFHRRVEARMHTFRHVGLTPALWANMAEDALWTALKTWTLRRRPVEIACIAAVLSDRQSLDEGEQPGG